MISYSSWRSTCNRAGDLFLKGVLLLDIISSDLIFRELPVINSYSKIVSDFISIRVLIKLCIVFVALLRSQTKAL